MKTFDGYSKEKFSDTSVLLAGGGSKELSNFIGTLNWDSTNRKLQYKKIGDTNWSDLVTFGSNATNSTAYLPLDGGTITGVVTFNSVVHLLANQYTDSAGTGSLNLNNSDIYGVNSIKFAGLSDGAAEGLQWYRDSTHTDSLWVKNGVIYFTPNREWGKTGTNYTIYHSGNFSLNNYVTLNTEQTITGIKHFTGGVEFKGTYEAPAAVLTDNANLVFDTLNNLVFTGDINLLLMTLKNGGTSYGAITAVPNEITGLYYNNHKLLTANDAFSDLFSTSEYLINITIGNVTKKLTSSIIKTNLGLGLLAFKNSLTYNDVGAAASNHTHNYHGLNNKIIRAGGSYSWYNILQYNSDNSNPSYYVADCAMININSYTGCQPWIRAVDSEYGSWVLGLYTNLLHIGRIVKTNTSNELTYTWIFGSTGSLTISGSYYINSDIRYKNILKYCNYNIKDIAQLPIFLYTWKNKNDNIIHIGSSAQDVFKIIPELVTYNSNKDFYNLDYSILGAVAGITACKELVNLVIKFDNETKLTNNKIAQLESRIKELENLIKINEL